MCPCRHVSCFRIHAVWLQQYLLCTHSQKTICCRHSQDVHQLCPTRCLLIPCLLHQSNHATNSTHSQPNPAMLSSQYPGLLHQARTVLFHAYFLGIPPGRSVLVTVMHTKQLTTCAPFPLQDSQDLKQCDNHAAP